MPPRGRILTDRVCRINIGGRMESASELRCRAIYRQRVRDKSRWDAKRKTEFSSWGVGNAVDDTACALKFILPRLSRLRLFHQIGKRGLCNSLSPTQGRRAMSLFFSQGFVQFISPYYEVALSPPSGTRCQRLPWWHHHLSSENRDVSLPTSLHYV